MSRVGPVAPDPSATAQFRVGGTSATLNAASEGSWGACSTSRSSSTSCSRSAAPPRYRRCGTQPSCPARRARPAGRLAAAGTRIGAGSGRDAALGRRGFTRAHCRRRPGAGRGAGTTAAGSTRPPMRSASSPATLVVTDRDPTIAPRGEHAGLGLRPSHPRYPARILDDRSTATALGDRCPVKVLDDESLLVRVGDGWTGPLPPADGLLLSISVHYVHDTGATASPASTRAASSTTTTPTPTRSTSAPTIVARISSAGWMSSACSACPTSTWSWTDPAGGNRPA